MSIRSSGKYRLIAELGQGGMADVFLGVTSQNAAFFTKLVVLKILKEHLASDGEFVTMFVDEARIAARLNHPNLVQTLEVGEDDGRHFLTMEYLDGQPLHRILNRGRDRIPQNMFLSILLDVLEGIHYAHELKDFDGTPLNIVHRDVTPHNVFVVYEGQVKVVDFGIAKAAGRVSETRHGVIKGKVAYMAPEQAMGQLVDRRVDVFAVGVMLFEAATGTRMWKGLKETEIIRRLLGGKIPAPRDVNPRIDEELNQICMRALAFSPSLRYPTAADFQKDLALYLHKQGPRPTSRQIGSFVAELFADKRVATQKIIESQLAQLRAQATSVPQIPLAALPTSMNEAAAEASGDPFDGGASAEPAMPESLRGPGMSRVPPQRQPPPPQPPLDDGRTNVRPRPQAPVFLLAVAAVLVMLLTGIVTATLFRSSNPGPIMVTLRATPLETRFSIDDGPLLENPYIGPHPRDGRQHLIRALAPGQQTKETSVVFDNDVSMRFTLTGGAEPPVKKVEIRREAPEAPAASASAPR